MAIKLKMVRRGKFSANWLTTENMCGITPSLSPTYNYVCEIECGTVLDSHGFMIDQLDVDRYFQVKFTASRLHPSGVKALSCERMAIICCDDVKYLVESHMMRATGGSEIHRIAVTIFFNDTAAMTAEWKATDEHTCDTISRKQNRKTPSRQRVRNASNSSEGAAAGRLESSVVQQSSGDHDAARVSIRRLSNSGKTARFHVDHYHGE